ncbi:hypothetical protein Bpfe_006061 [Biomphalaria pfeifferi]|uniref:Uncharacterized protein n=1 Tax=Biomphalaria pfeifferi TaxID=112525 RepID=A0AAD8C238_BIOPF|nr:hypothetical protein Bpfe_006061 [Biomphalaria pfeifferi]
MGRPLRRSAEAASRTNCSDDNYRDGHYLYTCQKTSANDNGHEEVNATITTSSQERTGPLEKEKAAPAVLMASWVTRSLPSVAPTDDLH